MQRVTLSPFWSPAALSSSFGIVTPTEPPLWRIFLSNLTTAHILLIYSSNIIQVIYMYYRRVTREYTRASSKRAQLLWFWGTHRHKASSGKLLSIERVRAIRRGDGAWSWKTHQLDGILWAATVSYSRKWSYNASSIVKSLADNQCKKRVSDTLWISWPLRAVPRKHW